MLAIYSQRPASEKPFLEGATQQYRAAIGRRALHDADLRVGRHIGVLPVRLDDPSPLCVRVNHVVNTAVVLHWCGRGLISCLSVIPTPHECQAMGPIGIR